MSEMSADLVSAVRSMIERIEIDTRTPAEHTDDALWEALRESGFTSIDVPEAAGGHGGDTADAMSVLTTITESGALVPYAEHAMLAAWLAGSAGHELPDATATIAVADADLALDADGEQAYVTGVLRDVVHVSAASVVVALVPGDGDRPAQVATLPLDHPGVSVSAGADLLGASIGDVTLDRVPAIGVAETPVDAERLRERGALVYAAALAAAARAVCDRTVQYASERVQFGRPLTKFQAVQQRLATLAALATMMEVASSRAVAAGDGNPVLAEVSTAAAKVVTSLYGHAVAAAGHQIHGAIGFTSEHSLGRFTTALWTWRDRHGTEREWASGLAGRILDDGLDPWDLITGTVDDATRLPASAEGQAQ